MFNSHTFLELVNLPCGTSNAFRFHILYFVRCFGAALVIFQCLFERASGRVNRESCIEAFSDVSMRLSGTGAFK